MIKVGIIGATGYAGNELVRLLLQHKEAEIIWYGSRSYIDKKYAQVYANMFQLVEDICLDEDMEELAEKADVIFVPGGDQGALAVKAAELYREGYAPWVLPSGRFSKPVGKCMIPGYETEWEFLRDILVEQGVPAEAILEERQATFTYENAIYSRQVTDGLGLEIKKAILCPQAFHARRCLLYYEILYPDTEFFVCPTVTQGVSRENWYQREDSIDLVLGEMERCGTQFHEILREYGM